MATVDREWREKERDLTQSYDEPTHQQKKPKSKATTRKLHQNFDYTTIADRLRTVSWGNNSPQLVWLTGLRDPNLPTNHKSRVINRTHI